MKFLWVFNEDDKNKLIESGYELISTCKQKQLNIYQFKSNNKINFNKTGIKSFKFSDLMLF